MKKKDATRSSGGDRLLLLLKIASTISRLTDARVSTAFASCCGPLLMIAESTVAQTRRAPVTCAQKRNRLSDLDEILHDGRNHRPNHLHIFW